MFKSNKSMWRKSREKKQAHKLHATNFSAGYVRAQEYHLNRTGLRGRKQCLLWTALCLLLLIAAANLALNCMLLVMMNFTPSGLPYLVFSDNDDIIFTQNIHIEETLLSEGIQGFYNTTLQIGSEDLSSMTINSGPPRRIEYPTSTTLLNASQLSLTSSAIVFNVYDTFSLYSPVAGEVLQVNESLANIPSLVAVENLLQSERVFTNKVSSQNLLVQGHDMHILGNNISISASRSLEISSNHDIRFAVKSEEASFNIKSSDIVLPRLTTGSPASNPSKKGMAGYHLCVCGNSGRVFRVPGHCAAANEYVNPCS